MQETKGSINLGRVNKSIGVYSIILPEKCWRNISLGENPSPSLSTVSVCVYVCVSGVEFGLIVFLTAMMKYLHVSGGG